MITLSGPLNARVMIVGEAPTEEDLRRRTPLSGAPGFQLDEQLAAAGLNRHSCSVTLLARERPPGNDIGAFIAFRKKDITPGHVRLRDKYVTPALRQGYDLLMAEIGLGRPNVIIALGNVAMWALTGRWGINDWRGSELFADQIMFEDGTRPIVIPTFHPAAILRQYELRPLALIDLKKAAKMQHSREITRPNYEFIIRPDYDTTLSTLKRLIFAADERIPWAEHMRLSVDIETRAGHIACLGIAWSRTEAICIPFMQALPGGVHSHYWTEDEEFEIVRLLRILLTLPHVAIVGQNFNYDAQYISRHWCFTPVAKHDTMIGHHALICNLGGAGKAKEGEERKSGKKGLGFLSSIYCERHVYWKDDIEWTPEEGEEKYWRYNCEDCVRTFEIAEVITWNADNMGMRDVYNFQQSLNGPVLRTINRGVRIDEARRSHMALELDSAILERNQWLASIFGEAINVRSRDDMHRILVDGLGIKPILKRRPDGTYSPSFDDESLRAMADKEPLLRQIVPVIADIRSLGVFLSTFIGAPLDTDRRMRCAYNIAGTVTYRFSSAESAFGAGTNLQNIPKGDG